MFAEKRTGHDLGVGLAGSSIPELRLLRKTFDPEEIEGGGPASLAVVLGRSGDLSEEHKNPIPSRTRPLNSSAPMVLCLKTRESRSLPGLPRTNTTPLYRYRQRETRRFFTRAPRSCLSSRSPSKPASKAMIDAGWSSPVARQAHNLKVTGSNPVPATTDS